MHLAFQISSFALGLTVFIFTLIQGRTEKKHNKLFLILIGILMVSALSDVVTALADPYRFDEAAALAVAEGSRTVYFIVHNLIGLVFFYYIETVCSFYTKKRRISNGVNIAFAGLLELITLTNPFTHWIFYYDSSLNYTRGRVVSIISVGIMIYFGAAMLVLLRTWMALTYKRRAAIIFFFFVVVTGIAIQMIFMQVKVEILAETIGLLGIMVAVEDENEWMDFSSGCFNRKAFRMDLTSMILSSRPLTIIGIRITNAESIVRNAGVGSSDNVFEPVAHFLQTLGSGEYVYSINSDTFAVIMPETDEAELEDTLSKLRIRFEVPFSVGSRKMLFNATVLAASHPDRIKNADDALYMLDSPVPATGKFLYRDKDLDYLLRRRAVEKAVMNGLAQSSFDVFYQPTYDINGTLHGAEALVRMHDEELGDVYPDEFIPISEELGIIGEIDDFVLRTVCRFISMSQPFGLGLECINVNLSVVQCMDPGFVEHIDGIVEECGIDKAMINFEITESVAASDYNLLGRIISELKGKGYKFSMDDYGMGYSNMTAVMALDLDVIKIDKSILWGAEESELGYIILENNVRMIRQMKRKILVEGVETPAQVEMLRKLNVDYLQGYYFSRPVPQMIFTQKITNANA